MRAHRLPRLAPTSAPGGWRAPRFALLAGLLALAWGALLRGQVAAPSGSPAGTPPRPLVVVLHSYDTSYDWTRQMAQGLRSVLGHEEARFDLREEFLDTRKNTAPAQLVLMHDLLAAKYAGVRPALVITSDTIATRLVRDHPALFGGAPVVFGGVDDLELIGSLPRDRFTGVTEWFNLERVVSLVERLRPDMRRICIVTDAKPAGDSWRRYFASVQPRTRVQLQSLAGSQLALGEILTRLTRETGPDDLVLSSNFTLDAPGGVYATEEAIAAITGATRAPVIGLGMARLRPGLLGVARNSGESHGRRMAQKALLVLEGQSPARVPIDTDDSVSLTLDWNELQAHGLAVGDLPEDVDVVNRPTSFYRTYRRMIWVGAALMVLQSLVIGGLVLNVRRRQRAEMELARHAQALSESNEALRREQGVRLEAEAQLRHAQKMEAVGRLAGGVAHDFNNLLTVIMGYCALLLSRTPDTSPDHEALDQIRRASDQAAALTQNLLTFGRRQFTAPTRVDVVETISSITPMLRRACDVRVTLALDLAPDTGAVWMGKGQLEQVLLNLVLNARDAMPDGGRLRIVTRHAVWHGESPADALVAGRHHTVITVADTGVGMDEETRTRIFEPFFTTKPTGRGTGLGLSTVYGIVTQAGGSVMVTSAPGAGATFTLWLPRLADGADAVPLPA